MCPPPSLKTKYYKYNRRPPMSFSCITFTVPLPQGESLLWIKVAHFHVLLSTYMFFCTRFFIFFCHMLSSSMLKCVVSSNHFHCHKILHFRRNIYIIFSLSTIKSNALQSVTHVSQGTCVRAPLGRMADSQDTHSSISLNIAGLLPDMVAGFYTLTSG